MEWKLNLEKWHLKLSKLARFKDFAWSKKSPKSSKIPVNYTKTELLLEIFNLLLIKTSHTANIIKIMQIKQRSLKPRVVLVKKEQYLHMIRTFLHASNAKMELTLKVSMLIIAQFVVKDNTYKKEYQYRHSMSFHHNSIFQHTVILKIGETEYFHVKILMVSMQIIFMDWLREKGKVSIAK